MTCPPHHYIDFPCAVYGIGEEQGMVNHTTPEKRVSAGKVRSLRAELVLSLMVCKRCGALIWQPKSVEGGIFPKNKRMREKLKEICV